MAGERTLSSAAAVPWSATGHEPQVFFDVRGRRGRAVRGLGALMGVLSAGSLTLIVTGALGFAAVPAARPAFSASVERRAAAPPSAAGRLREADRRRAIGRGRHGGRFAHLVARASVRPVGARQPA